jgi:predicted metal-dependent HD superfamily phosphohydrolase
MTGAIQLERRFVSAFRAAGAQADAAPVLAQLRAAYEQPHRRYHTLEHIAHTLAWLDWTAGSAQRPHEIALALWFHDYVYDPLRRDNEAASAQAARQVLLEAGVEQEAIARIAEMIVATGEHIAQVGDAALLVDIDLAILGAAADDFARFEAQVREEYAMFDDATYARGRAHVLSKLAARRPLYATPVMAEELERRARQNLASAVARWQAASAGGVVPG